MPSLGSIPHNIYMGGGSFLTRYLSGDLIMKAFKVAVFCLFIVAFAASVQAGPVKPGELSQNEKGEWIYTPKGELVLNKQPFYMGVDGRFDQRCDGLFYIDGDKDIPDLRDFRLFYCLGRYEMTLDGPAGRAVSLFGDFRYGQDWGYLIIKKTDGKKVWILDLEDFPPNQWAKIPPSKDGYGGFEVYYHPSPQFEQKIASVKWGEWWKKDSIENHISNVP